MKKEKYIYDTIVLVLIKYVLRKLSCRLLRSYTPLVAESLRYIMHGKCVRAGLIHHALSHASEKIYKTSERTTADNQEIRQFNAKESERGI